MGTENDGFRTSPDTDASRVYILPEPLLEDLARFVRVRKGSEEDARELASRLEIHAEGPLDVQLDQATKVLEYPKTE